MVKPTVGHAPGESGPYYGFIDGLRAIAVLAVVAYHADPRWMPGGFSGVDMFFAISGFVVSASVAGFDTRNFFAFAGRFYARRMRRILPALLACMLATGLLAALFVPQAWLSDGSHRTGLMAFLGLSNYQLAATAGDYFSPRTDFNPYTHTWSLGVEEQFYVLFPLLFLAWLRGGLWRKLAIGLFAAGLAASLAYAGWLSAHGKQAEAFYLTATRFWQLASGVLLYQCMARTGEPSAGRPWPRWLRALVLVASLALLAGGLLLARALRTPWPDGLAPVVGTLGVIAALVGAGRSNPVGAVLGSVPMAWIGRVSYSLYLWHWPVFVLFRWTVGLESAGQKLSALAVAVLAAMASYYWIETPLRRGRWILRLRPRLLLPAGLLLIVASGLAFSRIGKHADWLSRSVVMQNQSDWYPEHARPQPVAEGCLVSTGYERLGDGSVWVLQRNGCRAPVAARPRLFVAGDSHATAYLPMLRRYAMDTGVEVRIHHSPGCTYFGLGLAREFDDARCRGQIEAAVADIRTRAQAGDVVFLPALRLQRLSDQWVKFDPAEMKAQMTGQTARQARKDGVAYAVRTLRPLADDGLRIVFEAPKPLFPAPPYRCSDVFNRRNPVCAGGLSMPKSELAEYRKPVVAAMEEATALLPGATVWDPFPVLCEGRTCAAADRDGRPLFFDGDHLSGHGNATVYPAFVKHLESLGKGPDS